MRSFNVPVGKVWVAVSTKEGLDHWWMGHNVELDLRPGGLFKHHWENKVSDFKENEYIDFGEESLGFGGMRFELEANGDATVFSFIDSWGENATPPNGADPIGVVQPGGPGTPWSGPAGGWHSMVDGLENYLTAKTALGLCWGEGLARAEFAGLPSRNSLFSEVFLRLRISTRPRCSG